MYLKSIEIHGFKSFANKINFEFHNGITAIVGPNGSGKSNVGDAVRWVLGEQSAKQLRGGNMQDVIFSGTELRRPLGFASVAITLDNSDHKLDIDFEEVTVTRRLYRSGESEYLLNGSQCRLKDINELFYDTGIGKEGYSIIGQGQIDKILSGKPEERRELFDEAAGIVKFKRRKATALKKLADEQQNLVRVNDILSELTRQLGPLEKQSETARVYLKKKEELKYLDVNLFLVELEHIRTQWMEVEAKRKAAEQELKETSAAFEKTKQEYEELEKQLEQLDEKIESSREASGKSVLEKQQLVSQVELLKEQIHAAHMNDDHYRARIETVQEEIARRSKELAERRAEEESVKSELSGARDEEKAHRKALEELQEKIAGKERAIDEGKQEIISLLNSRASTKGKMQRYDTMLEQISIRRAELNQKLIRLKSEEEIQNSKVLKLREQYDAVNEKIQQLSGEGTKLDEEIQSIQDELVRQDQQFQAGQTAFHREASRLESLRNITERYDGYGSSIRRVMEQKEKNPGIHGVVADLIKTNKEYETAIETALGGSIQNIVTDNENTAKYLIEFLKRNRFGRATFLPLTSMNRRQSFSAPQALNEPGVVGLASDLVACEPLYRGMAAQLLGRTLVLDHIDHAIALARKYKHTLRMVTLDGELLSPGGSMTGGAFKNSSNLLGRRREIEELEGTVKRLKSELAKMQEQIQKRRSDRNRLREQRSTLNEEIQEQNILRNTAQVNLDQESAKVAAIRKDYEQAQREGAEIEGQIREIQSNRRQITTEMEESQTREKELEQEILTDQENLEVFRKEEEACNSAMSELQIALAGLRQKHDFVGENISRLNEELTRFAEEQEEIRENLKSGGEEIARKEDQIAQVRAQIARAEENARLEEERLKEYSAEKDAMTAQHKSFFQKRDELSEHMSLMDKECFRLNSQREKLEENKETQVAYLWEEYELTPIGAAEMRMEEKPDRAKLRSGISELKEEIRKLGDVNVNAIEDYKELFERYTFMEAQHTDLVEAAKTLEGIIEELDTGMRRQFTEKFEEIRKEFDSVFRQLFGGGRGTLELMEDEDVLEAGIRIISQPPGKKLQNMMQLSGGEKALTAIALLFAIQNLKPSPFCLLDEIEAALDDSNVARYARYLHKLTKNTQFIIITHRRGTMNAADRLYGITMQEKGVSTLVSVSLIEKDLDK